jgi:hypothetical protein
MARNAAAFAAILPGSSTIIVSALHDTLLRPMAEAEPNQCLDWERQFVRRLLGQVWLR